MKVFYCVGGALSDLSAIEIHTAHPRLCRKGNELCIRHFRDGATSQTVLLGQDDNASAFGSLVSQGGELCSIGQFLNLDSRCREKLRGLTVSQGDGPRFIEEQHVHVPGRFNGPAAHGQYVLLDHAINSCNPDGAEQAADGRGDQTDQQRD